MRPLITLTMLLLISCSDSIQLTPRQLADKFMTSYYKENNLLSAAELSSGIAQAYLNKTAHSMAMTSNQPVQLETQSILIKSEEKHGKEVILKYNVSAEESLGHLNVTLTLARVSVDEVKQWRVTKFTESNHLDL